MNNLEVTISPAIPADAEGIQKVFYKTWLATYPNEELKITLEDLEYKHKDMFISENIKWRKDQIENMKDAELFLVAKSRGEIIGVSHFEIEENKNFIQAIFVLPEYQGMGIGKKFWAHAKKFFDPEKDITVEVAEYTPQAINFYKSLGFKDTGRRFSEERYRMRNGSIFPEMEMILKRGWR